ncbi:MAG: amidohydrolase family protein, partial [Acidobacteria bacterium]|nr:amidohydrolase family protein [Acidobacteriota bacterium]
NAAEHLGKLDELGTLEPGKLADLIIVDGDPLMDISVIHNIEVVIKGGKVVVDHR